MSKTVKGPSRKASNNRQADMVRVQKPIRTRRHSIICAKQERFEDFPRAKR
jgi:hypothetical protein